MDYLTTAPWRTSSYSHPQGEQCIEVAPLAEPKAVVIRDSKRRDGGAHVVSRRAWHAFVAHIKLNK